MTKVSYTWHEKPTIIVDLERFHDNCACPHPALDRMRKTHMQLTNQIRSRLLEEKLCKRIEHCGAAHHGIQIGSTVEFDVLLVLDGGGLTVVSSPHPDSFYLKAYKRFLWGLDDRYTRFMDEREENMIVPQLVGEMFFRTMNGIIRDFHLSYKTKLLQYGPIVQIQLSEYGHVVYTANYIPCFEENDSWMTDGKRQFIARPVNGRYHFAKESLVWRQCFAIEENEFLYALDRISTGSDCRKKLLRILKTIPSKQTTLASLSSYHFKAALFVCSSKMGDVPFWRENNIVQRLMDLLQYLQDCLEKGHMDHPVLGSDVNLLEHISTGSQRRMFVTIKRIRTCEFTFKETIELRGMQRDKQRSGNNYSWKRDMDQRPSVSQTYCHDVTTCKACLEAEKMPQESSCCIQ